MRSRNLACAAAAAPYLVLLLACSEDSDKHLCDSQINTGSLSSPSLGVVEGTGHFAGNESVLARFPGPDGSTIQRVGIPTGNSIRFEGVTSGTKTIEFYVSCEKAVQGQEYLGVMVVVVK